MLKDHLATGPHIAYRLYDRQGALLYVGASYDFLNRMIRHRKRFADALGFVEAELYDDFDTCIRREHYLIATLRPPFGGETILRGKVVRSVRPVDPGPPTMATGRIPVEREYAIQDFIRRFRKARGP